MRRILALGVAFIALIAAGLLWTRDRPAALATVPALTVADATPDGQEDTAEPSVAPAYALPRSEVTPAEREARRFNRYDKDRNGAINRDEYLANRKKAFAKLDLNGDGKLSFDEYTVKTVKKFATADRNGDGTLTPPEFATTAIKRKPRAPCPPGAAVEG